MANISKAWVVVSLASLGMFSVALFYQYALGTAPCVLCIHARLWTAGLILVGAIGMIVRKSLWAQPLLAFLGLGFSYGLGETAYGLLATERAWSIGSCSFDAGLPSWFAVDEWLPSIFMPLEPCGYTPELLFGVTMAEGLMAAAVLLGALSTFQLVGSMAALIVSSRASRSA